MTVAGPVTTQLADDNDDDGLGMDFDDVLDFTNQDEVDTDMLQRH